MTRAVGRIKLGLQKKLYLGNLDAQRDWGFAGDYVNAMWLMLQQDEPDDYVIGSGAAHSVKELVQIAFEAAEVADWEKYVTVDPRFFRPAEVDFLLADPSKAKKNLGWQLKISFEQMIKEMVAADLAELSRLEAKVHRLEERLGRLEGREPA